MTEHDIDTQEVGYEEGEKHILFFVRFPRNHNISLVDFAIDLEVY